jgi:hypothetical protein
MEGCRVTRVVNAPVTPCKLQWDSGDVSLARPTLAFSRRVERFRYGVDGGVDADQVDPPIPVRSRHSPAFLFRWGRCFMLNSA